MTTADSIGPTSILGLPQHLQCYAEAFSFPSGARQPGNDIHIDYTIPDRFLMTLSIFHANEPIHGLLMYDRGEAAQMRIGRPPIPTRPAHDWLFFGYLCERCQQTFLLPYWASNKDDLPRAVRHSCFGGMDIDEVPRQGIRQLASEVAVQLLDKFTLQSPQLIDRKTADYIGHLIFDRFETALESFWQQMVNLAVEKAQGRHR